MYKFYFVICYFQIFMDASTEHQYEYFLTWKLGPFLHYNLL